MRALVIGGSGQIGGWLLHVLRERGHTATGTFQKVPYPGLAPLDAANLDQAAALVRAERPDVVFYPAGFTWVDGCERDPALARAANLEQPMNVARAAAALGAKFVYFSTDYVFDGVNGPYDESSPTNPLSAYGRAKLDAEHALENELGDNQLTLRTSWVFGPERQGKNFAYQLVKALRNSKTVECPVDQISSPSYGPDVALAAVRLFELGRSGLLHVVGPEIIDRKSFAEAIARAFELPTDEIIGKRTSELAQGAPRPLNGGLLANKLDSLLPGVMRPLSDSLADFVRITRESSDWAVPGQ